MFLKCADEEPMLTQHRLEGEAVPCALSKAVSSQVSPNSRCFSVVLSVPSSDNLVNKSFPIGTARTCYV